MISKEAFLNRIMTQAITRNRYAGRFFYFMYQMKHKKSAGQGKPTRSFYFLTIANRKSFPMVKASIRSFIIRSPYLPEKVIIVSDGSWGLEEGEKYFQSAFKGILFEFSLWEDCSAYFQTVDPSLSIWAKKQIWGKKMAAILKYSVDKLVLFSDPDILWYNTPIVESDFQKDILLKLSIDNSHNYDSRLIREMKAEYLYKDAPINCGVVLIKGNVYEKSSLLRKATSIEASQPGDFAEQTVFALLAKEYGEVWPEARITATIDDILQPIFQRNNYPDTLIARHYLFLLKWIYWKDLLLNF